MTHYNSSSSEVQAMLDKSRSSYDGMRERIKRRDLERAEARKNKQLSRSIEVI